MKILHSADLHLDSPFTGRTEAQARYLRQKLLEVPEKLAQLCKQEQCDLMLLSGDLFDGPWTQESFTALRHALEDAAVPVFISPGNHDFVSSQSPYEAARWPGNVHVFTRPVMESVPIQTLDCKIYGAGYRSMDCDSLLDGFRAVGEEKYHIAVLHGDPTQIASPYCPVTQQQIRESNLDYLALGHVHKGGALQYGKTLCAWPGCPMGRGFDELDTKGALIVSIDETTDVRFVPLDTVRFYDYETTPTKLADLLPAVGNEHFYRITLTGESPTLDLQALAAEYSRFPNLELRDRTVPETDIWGSADEDSLEGVYFRLLKDALHDADEESQKAITLAARISRQILDGQEVTLP